MWSNIGEKLKILAMVVAIIGIITSIITGCVLIYQGYVLNQAFDKLGNTLFYSGLGTIIGGSLFFWILSMYTYGFGELIVKATEIEQNTRKGEIVRKNIESKKIVIAENPDAIWNCPKCNTENSNKSFICSNCKYSIT